MREILNPTSAIAEWTGDSVALITDGRFSVASRGLYPTCLRKQPLEDQSH